MKLRYKDFQCFTEAELEVAGVTLVTGRSNSGKSALFRGFESVLYGTQGDDDIRHGAKKSEVQVIDGDLDALRTQSASTFKYQVNGETFASVGRKGHLDIFRKFGIGEINLGDDPQNLHFVGQFDPLFFVGHTEPQAYRLIALVLDDSKYQAVMKGINDNLRSYKERMGIVAALITDQIRTNQELDRQIETVASQAAAYEAPLCRLEAALDAAERLEGLLAAWVTNQKSLAVIQAEQTQLESVRVRLAKVDELSAKVDELSRLEAMQTQLAVADQLVEKVQSEQAKLAALGDLSRVEALAAKLAELKNLEAMQTNLVSLASQVQQCELSIKGDQLELDALIEQEKALMEQTVSCPVCQSPLDAEHREHVVRYYEEN